MVLFTSWILHFLLQGALAVVPRASAKELAVFLVGHLAGMEIKLRERLPLLRGVDEQREKLCGIAPIILTGRVEKRRVLTALLELSWWDIHHTRGRRARTGSILSTPYAHLPPVVQGCPSLDKG
jgi:hypothetical protein